MKGFHGTHQTHLRKKDRAIHPNFHRHAVFAKSYSSIPTTISFYFNHDFHFTFFSTDKADAMSNDGTSNHWFEPLLTAILAKVTRPGALRRFARNHNNYRNRQDKEFRLVSWTTLTASARNARQSLSKKYMLQVYMLVTFVGWHTLSRRIRAASKLSSQHGVLVRFLISQVKHYIKML